MTDLRTRAWVGSALAVALALMAAGCGGSTRAPRPPAPTTLAADPSATSATTAPTTTPTTAPPVDRLPAQVEALVRGYQAMAAAAGPTAPCPAVAQAITATATATVGARQAVQAAARGERAGDVDAMMVAAGDRLGPAVATLDTAAVRCAGEPTVGRALDALDH